MEKRVRKFDSHEDADAADREYYRSLTPQQRMEIFYELQKRGGDGTGQGFKRVYRIVKFGED
ncbi:MAG: hypothetical protein COA73_15480 [Candidatus Hydrogenedentota bacterium]|nr:MAG: hypothetical protein COA73_15480 [Candidatus Hydrogenedentota bacterium]